MMVDMRPKPTSKGWNHKAVCLLAGHSPFRGYLRRFHLSETTGECICSTGTRDTIQHIIEECEDDERKEAREGLRRRQEAIGGGVPLPSEQTDQRRGGKVLQQVRGGDQDGRETWAREEDDEEDDEDR
jgi:hypothetical protein